MVGVAKKRMAFHNVILFPSFINSTKNYLQPKNIIVLKMGSVSSVRAYAC